MFSGGQSDPREKSRKSREKTDASYAVCPRQEEVPPPRYAEQIGAVRSGERGRGEEEESSDDDDDVQTLALLEKTTKVRLLGVPLVEVTRQSRWTDIPVIKELR